MKREMILPVLLSFGISLALGPVLIPFLRKVKAGQKEREEGVPSHQKKAGTPTMGGLVILSSIIITSLLYIRDYPKIIPVLFMTVGFGVVGFLDDYIKIVLVAVFVADKGIERQHLIEPLLAIQFCRILKQCLR